MNPESVNQLVQRARPPEPALTATPTAPTQPPGWVRDPLPTSEALPKHRALADDEAGRHRDVVAKALIGWGRQARAHGVAHRPALVNGEPGLVFYEPDGPARSVAALEIADGVVVAVRSVLNPDKLTHVPA